MPSAIDTALSGLNVASTRVAVASNNIANQASAKSIVNGQPSDKPFVPQQVDQVSLSSGGVRATVNAVSSPTQEVPNQDGNGLATVPNVDQASQLSQLNIASYDFKANLKVIKTQQNLDKALLDIKS